MTRAAIIAPILAGILTAEPTVPLPPSPPDSLERSRAVHVLERLGYGPRPGDVDRVLAMGVDEYIRRQLEPATIPDEPLASRLRDYEILRTTAPELAALLRHARAERRRAAAEEADGPRTPGPGEHAARLRRLMAQFSHVAVVRAVLSEHQLLEVMADFWFNHFNVFLRKGPEPVLLPSYVENVIRRHALGRFEDLLIATATSPAMLVYLDNVQSVAPGARPPARRAFRERGAPPGRGDPRGNAPPRRIEAARPTGINENYARELLELHTVGVDGGYRQDDVVTTARIFTGWSVDPRTLAFRFNSWAHDAGEKVVLGRRYPEGGGMEEGLDLLRALSHHPATMRHVSRKLCVRFVADDPPEDCIAAAVEAWRTSDGYIPDVLGAIIASPSFWRYPGEKYKTPFEFVVSAVRAVGADPGHDPVLPRLIARLGQPLYGQEAPTGYPETADAWTSPGVLFDRIEAALALAHGRLPGIVPDLDALVPSAGAPDDLVAAVDREILGNRASALTRNVMLAEAQAGAVSGDPRPRLVALALGSPEFQRQ